MLNVLEEEIEFLYSHEAIHSACTVFFPYVILDTVRVPGGMSVPDEDGERCGIDNPERK